MRYAVLVTLLAAALVPAAAEDQQKAVKQLNRITALSSDFTGRRVVSMTIADMLQISRPDLIRQRRAMNLNYGGIFLAYQLTVVGVSLDDLAARLRSGKTIFQVPDDLHVDWKSILASVKKLNSKVEEKLYDHFINDTKDKERESKESYNVLSDLVKADGAFTADDLDAARDVYTRIWGMAAVRAGQHGGSLSTMEEQAAFKDHTSDRLLMPTFGR